jgi:hypothetical protein
VSPEEWVGLIAGLIAIAGAFVAALRWTVRQFVLELGNQMFARMDKLEIEIGVLTARQSEIYATLMTTGGAKRGKAKDEGTKTRKPKSKRASR